MLPELDLALGVSPAENKDSQIAHGSSYQDYKTSRNAHKIAIRHRQVGFWPAVFAAIVNRREILV